MIKTLLLCFIHGFKGDEETFFKFPEDLRQRVVEKRSDLEVHTAVYPKYETRGDLAACAEAFREWLQAQVTELETNAAAPSAIIDPSVSVILVAHSMGGFVVADTLFSVLDNRPVSQDPDSRLMFPLIQGVMAFDTPYNGLSRSMFAYGVFSQYQNISSIWSLYSTVSSLGAGAATSQIATTQGPTWARWSTLASRTGTYGALLAGGAAAYTHRAEIAEYLAKINKQSISESWSKVNKKNISEGLSHVSRDSVGEGFTWMSSHLKFIGALMKQTQLATRLERLSQLKGVGIVNLYTSLGDNEYWSGGYFVPRRTFCAIPPDTDSLKLFKEQVNTKAANEIEAHCNMFKPEKNPRYEAMATTASDLVLEWLKNDPRKIIDDYKPNPAQLSRSNSEAHLFNDDGELLTSGADCDLVGSDDTQQLEAILRCTDMPLPADDGTKDEDLKTAADIPLPIDEETERSWKSRLPNLPNLPAMPTLPTMPPLKSVSIPSVSVPRVTIPGWGRKKQVEVVET